MKLLKGGAEMSSLNIEKLLEDKPFKDRYYYIVHLLDCILIGIEGEGTHEELKNTLIMNDVLELHLFNEEKEIFISRIDGEFKIYKPMVHKELDENRSVITRRYELDPFLVRNNKVDYIGLELKEYVSYDKESDMAYVEKTVLHRFVRREEDE